MIETTDFHYKISDSFVYIKDYINVKLDSFAILALNEYYVYKIIEDVSTEKEKVQNIVDLFNKNKLSLYHVEEVLEDLL